MWFEMDTAPKREPIIGLYPDDEEVEIIWAETRRCMLAGIGGNGYFGPGWEDTCNRLIADDPIMWRPVGD